MVQGIAQVFNHVAFEDLGNLAPIFQNWGFKIDHYRAGFDILPSMQACIDADILVILGGPISANDEKRYPFLLDEMALIEARLARNLPTLGICLGAQMMARVLGSRVYAAQDKEIGWLGLDVAPSLNTHCIRHIAKEKTKVFHWHGETFDLPQGATHLASTPVCPNQAFGYGQSLAVQFHPEVTAQALELWLIGHAHEIEHTPEVGVQSLRQDSEKYAQAMQSHAILFWQGWLASIL